ncbi:MAG: TIGR03936 family radical SAM-associated protein, partial [Anaerolineaceae bacterium]|nr:TIGR03936 family radical SAM-associated protein [Anaerolineaceae bacterium]
MERIRICFEKTGAMRYTSHLDLQKVWIRALLRAKLPLAYTQGFHPTPKVAYAWPLPLGWGTEGELMDIWLDDPSGKEVEAGSFIPLVNRSMPAGLKIRSIEKLPYSDPALTIVIQSAVYRVSFPENVTLQHLQEQMSGIMSQETILRERRGKSYDMKPLIENWECGVTGDNEVLMDVQMAARDSAMGRPDE